MKKVLILEDETSIRSFVVINLRRAGYEAIEASTGEEALEQLREEINSRKEERETGFALKNIHEQICLTYGERDIMLESEAGKGMRVLFRIPLEKGV